MNSDSGRFQSQKGEYDGILRLPDQISTYPSMPLRDAGTVSITPDPILQDFGDVVANDVGPMTVLVSQPLEQLNVPMASPTQLYDDMRQDQSIAAFSSSSTTSGVHRIVSTGSELPSSSTVQYLCRNKLKVSGSDSDAISVSEKVAAPEHHERHGNPSITMESVELEQDGDGVFFCELVS